MAEHKSKKSYRQLSSELDEILDWFENADADVDEAVIKYDKAQKLIKQMEEYLKTAQNKIKKIQSSNIS
jgi:exodeoxyribonuclease VII small subunit